MVLTFRDFTSALRDLDLDRESPIIAHASLSAFGEVRGGSDTILGSLLATVNTVVMPTFTYKTMLIPETGPENNGIVYGDGQDLNRMAEFFTPDMPADTLMGETAETLRLHPQARRSAHPILSFSGIRAEKILESQSLNDPLAPIQEILAAEGWVVLLGVNHTVNTSVHYAEKLAGRKQFVRWALTPIGVLECPGFPGCSDGFNTLDEHLKDVSRIVTLGESQIQAVSLIDLIAEVKSLIAQNPLALLCSREECERCDAVRCQVQQAG